jgi:hypothetical protein
MNVADRESNDEQERHPAAPRPDEAGAQTQVDLISRYAHPRGATFDLRRFVAKYPVPVVLSCLALVGGTIAVVVGRRRRRDTWHARMDRLRRLFADAANGAS